MSMQNMPSIYEPEKRADTTTAEAVEDLLASNISIEHREYLLERHKSLHLVPLPSSDPTDTLNWPSWKKHACLFLAALNGMMATAMTVGVVPALEDFTKAFHVDITTASYLTTVPLLFLAIAPLIWIPLSERYGRRPIWVITIFLAAAFNFGTAYVKTYTAHMIMRILVSVFLSPGIALGQGVVMEAFFAKERAQKMGIWALLVNSGVPLGPFATGFLVQHRGWQWMYRSFAIVNLAQFFLCVLYGPETIYSGARISSLKGINSNAFRRQYLTLSRVDPKILGYLDLVEPFLLLAKRKFFLAVLAYAVSFNFVFVMLPIEMSIIYGGKFHLNPQKIGLNYLGVFVGALVGELIGGPLSDSYVRQRGARKNGPGHVIPEDRLVWAQVGLPVVIAGITVFLVQIANAEAFAWNITPTIGAGVAAFGMEIVSTVLITYCSDCYDGPQSASIGVIINFVRLAWGFVGPFWFPHMLSSCGLRGSAGLVSGLVVVFAILPVLLLQISSSRDVAEPNQSAELV